MFDILSMEMQDFKSYAGVHRVKFPAKPGLYYLTGKNLFNPHLGANGTGKTSFIDAINWCFYGRSTRGLRASEVVLWGEKSCHVEIALALPDRTYRIRRAQTPNSLTIDDKDVEQADVDALLRMSQEAFLYAVILPQFGESFFDLAPGPKLTLFSSIMNLDFWLVKSKRAATQADVLDSKIREQEKTLAHLRGKLETLSGGLKELRNNSDDFEVARKEILKELKAKIKKLTMAVRSMQGDESTLKGKASKAKQSYDDLRGSAKELEKQINAVGGDISELDGDLRSAEKRIKDLNADRTHLSSMVGTRCPTCLQIVDKDHVHDRGDAIQRVIDGHVEAHTEIEAGLAKLKKRRKGLRVRLEEMDELVRLAGEKYDGFRSAAQDSALELRAVTQELETATRNLPLERTKTNPFEKMLEDRQATIKASKDEIIETDDRLSKNVAKHEAVSYWINGFKRIRLFVIEEALKGLELEINNHLTSLGLLDWYITLDIERENKSGGITKGFSVFIHSPKYEKPVRFEAFSGGESQRIRLAGDLALSNLILQRAGFVGQIELYDEPSQHMSPEGLADLVEVLAERAEIQQKKIWLVDHHSFEFGGFAGMIVAVMDEEGESSLEWVSEAA